MSPDTSNEETRSERLARLRERIGQEGATEQNMKQSSQQPQEEKQYYVKPDPSPEPPVRQPAPMPEPAMPPPQAPMLPYGWQQGLGQPATHDRRSNVPFDQRYRKENYMIDKRILPYVYHWIESNGRSKVDAINRAWLKLLLVDGYPIDPNILDRPFKFDDLPK